MPTPSPTPLSTLRHAIAGFLAGGGLAAAAAVALVLRLLPADLPGKGDWEKLAFWGIWMLAMLHAFMRSGPVAQARINP
ncbi:MAG TPA: hypothetical protein PKE51_02105, partial [Gemmatimonadaceae bacterium]|nr:hypothetical protein [Gemmatimonadaceae bacterium]